MAFLRNIVTTGPGTLVVVESPHPFRAFLLDDLNNYRYGVRDPFESVDGRYFADAGPDGVVTAQLRAPQFGQWWLVVDSPATPAPVSTVRAEYEDLDRQLVYGRAVGIHPEAEDAIFDRMDELWFMMSEEEQAAVAEVIRMQVELEAVFTVQGDPSS
jgi:hypothetical protein